jgi:hypothetical protein
MTTSQRQQRRRSSSAAQVGLVVLMAREVEKAATLLDPADIPGSLPRFTRVVHAIVVRFSRMSAALAARQYAQDRRRAGLTDVQPIHVPADPPLELVASIVRKATTDLQQGRTTPADLDAAEQAVVQAAEDIVLEASHTTTLETVFSDQKAIGAARVPEPDCCAFCALLAIRGMVYKTDSFVRSNARFTGPGKVKVHDLCRCDLEAVFTAYEPSAQVREWQALYRNLPRGLSGTKPVLKAWRHAFREHQAAKVA